jgi:hypothetical protein
MQAYGVLAVLAQGLRSSSGKPVVLVGDLNCAHKEIDVYAPKKFTRAAGFTQVRWPKGWLPFQLGGGGPQAVRQAEYAEVSSCSVCAAAR